MKEVYKNMEANRRLYRLPRLIYAVIILMCVGLIYAWSILRTPLLEVFPDWNATKLSGIFSISMSFFIIGGFLGGRTQTKVSPKVSMIISAVLICGGFYGISLLNPANSQQSLILMYILYGVVIALGVGFVYNSCVTVMVKWFPDRVGVASGFCLMGFGLGGFFLGSVILMLVNTVGIFGCFKVLAIFNFVLIIIGAFIIRLPGENDHLPKAQSQPTKNAQYQNGGMNFTPKEMMQFSPFWVYFLWSLFIHVSGLLVISSAATITLYYGAPAILGMVLSLANGGVRFAIGGVIDKLGRDKTMTINNTLTTGSALFLIIGAITQSILLITCGLVLAGLGYGSTPTITASHMMHFFGKKHYAVNIAILNFSVLVAALIGPIISGKLQDLSGGAYFSSFILALLFGVLSIVTTIVLRRFEAKQHIQKNFDSEKLRV